MASIKASSPREGAFTFANGDKYVGQILENRFNGQGTFTWSDGSKYEGGWTDGVKTGAGIKTWGPDTTFAGDTYSGNFQNDKPNGQGTYNYADGRHLCGHFQGRFERRVGHFYRI